MVFGNMGEDSATGVAFTRNAATGENKFNGRITSYNVCYTKLLRFVHPAVKHCSYGFPKLFPRILWKLFVITSYSIHYTKLYELFCLPSLQRVSKALLDTLQLSHLQDQDLKLKLPLLYPRSLPSAKETRITSYNVCYTKLLRTTAFPRRF